MLELFKPIANIEGFIKPKQQGCPQDVKSPDREETETINLQDRDETETFKTETTSLLSSLSDRNYMSGRSPPEHKPSHPSEQ